MTLDAIVNADSKFDPTTPFGTWDTIAREYENSTDKIIFNLDRMTIADAVRYNGMNGSPTPISGDMLANYKASKVASAKILDQLAN